jgi:hypothetical protein
MRLQPTMMMTKKKKKKASSSQCVKGRKEGYGSVLVSHGAVAEKIVTAQHGHLMNTRN